MNFIICIRYQIAKTSHQKFTIYGPKKDVFTGSTIISIHNTMLVNRYTLLIST